MQQLLNLPHPPTVVFAIHDLVAVECLQALLDRGLRILDNVTLVGLNNWRLSLTTKPPLATMTTLWLKLGDNQWRLY